MNFFSMLAFITNLEQAVGVHGIDPGVNVRFQKSLAVSNGRSVLGDRRPGRHVLGALGHLGKGLGLAYAHGLY